MVSWLAIQIYRCDRIWPHIICINITCKFAFKWMKSMKRESAVNVQYMQVHCTDQCIIESVVSHYLFTTADADNTTHMPRIENLQEVTTVNDSLHNVVAFSFDLFTGDVNISSADSSTIFQLRWETANKEASGLITPTVTKGRGFNQTNHSDEGAVTYNFTVDATTLGEGPLLVTLFAKLQCSHYSSSYCNRKLYSWCTCSQWQYGAESETVKISAKKGKSHASQPQLLYHGQRMILLQCYRVLWSQTLHFMNIHEYII